jgi:hypothetical protein
MTNWERHELTEAYQRRGGEDLVDFSVTLYYIIQ